MIEPSSELTRRCRGLSRTNNFIADKSLYIANTYGVLWFGESYVIFEIKPIKVNLGKPRDSGVQVARERTVMRRVDKTDRPKLFKPQRLDQAFSAGACNPMRCG